MSTLPKVKENPFGKSAFVRTKLVPESRMTEDIWFDPDTLTLI